MTGNFSLLRWIFTLYLCVLHLVLFPSHRFELSPQMTTNFGELWKRDLFIKLEPLNFDLRWKWRNVKIYMTSSLLTRSDTFSTSGKQYSSQTLRSTQTGAVFLCLSTSEIASADSEISPCVPKLRDGNDFVCLSLERTFAFTKYKNAFNDVSLSLGKQ